LNEEDLSTITDSFLIDMLDEILVKCVYCKQTDLERGNFAAHKNEMCPKTSIQCTASDIMCLWTGMRDELEKHLNSCIFNSLKPLITQLQNSNQPINDQVKQQKTQIRELIKVNKQFNSKVKQQKTQIEELIRENTDLNGKINVQQLAIEGFIEDNKQLHGKVDTQAFQELINKVNQQQTDIQGVQNENQRLKAQIQQLQNQTNRLQSKSMWLLRSRYK
jgi:predicted nuclease with TOPRIM domain